MKTLIIVESPHKANVIQGFVGDDYIVMASKGHITELAKGSKFGIGVDIKNNFKPRYILSQDKISILNELMRVAKECDNILIASDPDREGEAIAWHLQKRLEDVGKPIKRIVFNEIKKKAILKAIANTRDIDLNLFHAQEARRILDRIVGFMASPFLMNFVGDKLSAGRVQSVVTRMVADREEEISSFIPEDYWTIQVNLTNGSQEFITKYSGKLTDLNSANKIKNIFISSNDYIVSSISSKEELKNVFPPLVTSTLQRLMSKAHNFGADRTMKAAQNLYENGYCSYIRTDSLRISDEALDEVRDWLKNNNHDVPNKANIFKNKDAAQDAHECIRPTDVSLTPKDLPYSAGAVIGLDEKLVYENIWKYFVASQMKPAIYSTLRVTIHVKNNKQAELKAFGKALKYEGFLKILEIKDSSSIDIPNLSKNDILHLAGNDAVKMDKKQTQPPPRYSEDKLIKELVNKNIGRPATYAELLSKICTRNYVEKKGNVFHITDLGKNITNILSQYFSFMKYDYSADMESKLDIIESGDNDHIDMLNEFYKIFNNELLCAYEAYGGKFCEKCNLPMLKRMNRKDNTIFLSCSNYPKCNYSISK